MIRFLFLGDIVGSYGRKAVQKNIDSICAELEIDCVMANVENASGGMGITPKNAEQLHKVGVKVMTTGNHVWRHKEIYPFLDDNPWILRPANYPEGAPGRGWGIYTIKGCNVAVINLQGRVFMDNIDCPFRCVELLLENIKKNASVIIVDFHAEATSEKKAMLFFLAGKVTAVLGTHTHVQTNDAQVFENTGYITDVGMTGPYYSVIGMDPEVIINRFKTSLPQKFVVAKGVVSIQGVILEVDESSGKAISITPWQRILKK